MRIKVNSVGPVVKEKSYYFFELDYSQDGKPSQKPKKIMSFADVPYKALKDAKEGDNFDVKLQKDDNGYWQWVEVTQVAEGSSPTAAASGTTGKAGNWETSEERARRQILIVRQSCLAQAVATWGQNDTPPNDMDAITDLAAKYETWVNRE